MTDNKDIIGALSGEPAGGIMQMRVNVLTG